jgi:tetratricopeptide (TPR) repeat protein
MRALFSLLLCAVLAGCAGSPPLTRSATALFDDSQFAAPSERVSADEIFSVSEEMRRYLGQPHVHKQMRLKGVARGLLEALYDAGELKLEYDSGSTRNAAQAFDARAGNCISLVVMTAAFARELGLGVRYQSAHMTEAVSLRSDLLLSSGHLNLTVVPSHPSPNDPLMTVDFLPPEELRGLRWREVSESAVVAMYMNNRAVEALVARRVDDGYAWAKEAVRSDPDSLAALNTLGIVYLRRGLLPMAVTVFRHVLERDDANRAALANLVNAYSRQGRTEEARVIQDRLARLEGEPPLHYFALGLAAMERRDFRAARDLFDRELRRAGSFDELHYWLGRAHLELGNVELAQRHLKQAVELSTAREHRQLYEGKLAWLQGHRALDSPH